jgi:CPA2 family monovalent cation:H+ antiporter-2
MHDVAGAGGVSYRPSMHTMTPLISTLVGAFVAAFVFGLIANRLRVAPIAGFLVAGIVIGPFTPGFVADPHLAPELAEIGVILLMFGVGRTPARGSGLAVRRVAVPGAIAQIWQPASRVRSWRTRCQPGVRLALSVASTARVDCGLEQQPARHARWPHRHRWLSSRTGAGVVLLPAIAGPLGGGSSAAGTPWGEILRDVGLTLGNVVLFVALMLAFGRRFVPWLLARVASSGSQELFTLGVLAIALGVAFGSAYLFGVSFALGAFFAECCSGSSPISATVLPPIRCRSATHSRCCSSFRSACCSTRGCWSVSRGPCSRRCS